jgi:sulfite reductase (NADPH) flavoprotein alpha-component
MKEQAADLWAWLQNGANFYVCGDAHRMAKDVHQTLIEIAQEQGKLSPEAAAEYVNVTLMKTEKRYLRDVY